MFANLFLRIRRYLNYPADTHGKVEEIWQRMRVLSESFKIKVAGIENEVRYLKTVVTALQNQLNSMQDQTRASLPWIPYAEGVKENPEFLLLTHLAGFFPEPMMVSAGRPEDALLERLLNAGFKAHVLAVDADAAALRRKFQENACLQVVEVAAGSEAGALGALLAKQAISADLSVLKINRKGFDFEVIGNGAGIRPQIIMTVWDQTRRSLSVGQDDQASANALVERMRACGYQWNLLLFRTGNVSAVQFSVNLMNFPDATWGNLFFFKEFVLFDQAYRWLQGILPRFQHQLGQGRRSDG